MGAVSVASQQTGVKNMASHNLPTIGVPYLTPTLERGRTSIQYIEAESTLAQKREKVKWVFAPRWIADGK